MINAPHFALTAERRAEWLLMRDAMDGESAIKRGAETYLAKPGGFKNNPLLEDKLYDAYRSRAQFPEILAPSVAAMIGIIHGREIAITIPPAMQFLWEDADGMGLPLEAFHRRITRDLLVIGGYAVLADAPEGGGDPYLVGYARDAVVNWDRDWWVLDESGMRRDGFVWKQMRQFRLLGITDGGYGALVYEGDTVTPREVVIRARGGSVLPRIPFVVGNARDLSPRIESPPLIGVARASLAIYQLSADYRWQLFMSGQETLVVINGTAPTAVGASAVHSMMGSEGVTPDMKYVSPSCAGIDAHLRAMEDNRTAAVQAGARLLEQSNKAQESGEARRLRFASETATLTSIAQASAMILERALRNVAMLMGLPEDDITVDAPTDLLDRTMSPADAEALMRLWQGGAIAWPTFYDNLQRGGIASAERSEEEELALIESSDLGEPGDDEVIV
jgi:Domain of unknown function (DUF4055)